MSNRQTSRSPSSPHPPLSPSKVPVPPEHQQQQENPDNQDEDDEIPYPEPSDSAPLLPPPNFNPFYTIIEDISTGEHHHPYVHYVFADDDPSIVTAAAMRSLGLDDTEYLPSEGGNDGADERQGSEQRAAGTVESPLPPPVPGVEERYVIVDIAADGRTVLDAQSMSSAWQVTEASIRPAPSVDKDAEDKDKGYMLKIEGMEIPAKKKGKGKGKAGEASRPGEERFMAEREKAGGDAFKAMENILDEVDRGVQTAREFGGQRGESTIRVDNRKEQAGEEV